MVIVMEKHTAEGNIERVMSELIKRGFDVHRSTGSDQTVLGVVGQVFFFSSRRRHTRSVSAFLLNRSSDLHNRRNASSRLLLLISKHLILCIYLVFRILA